MPLRTLPGTMIEGFMNKTTIPTSGYGTVHVLTVSANDLASLHHNVGQTSSFAGHDLPFLGHVDQKELDHVGLKPTSGRMPDWRVTKGTDGYAIHIACNANQERETTALCYGPSLYNVPQGGVLQGTVNVARIVRGSGDKPINWGLNNVLEQRLRDFLAGKSGATEHGVCDCLGELCRANTQPFNMQCLLSLAPLTSEKRTVFSTQKMTPPTTLVGSMCTNDQSMDIKQIFLSLASRFGSGIYETPIPRQDDSMLRILGLNPGERNPLWLTRCNGGMFVCDRTPEKELRLRVVVKSRDFPGDCVDNSDNGNVQVYSLPSVGKLRFIVRATPGDCVGSNG